MGGGFGLILSRLFILSANTKILTLRAALIGGVLSRVLIISLSDMKVIIAYSSIVHMGIVVRMFLLGWAIGMWGCLLIIIRHGFTSSGMFYMANLIYLRSHSRSLILNKGLISINPRITISLIDIRYYNLAVVCLYCFLSLVYNLLLYSC